EPGIVCHHPKLTLQDDVEPDADGEAVDRGDQRLLEIHVLRLSAAAPVEQRTVRILVRRALPLCLVLGEKLDVAPGAKRLPGSGHDADVDLRIETDVAPARAHL